MGIELNRPALENARSLVRDGRVARDERDAWSEAAPTTAQENRYIDDHGWTAYSHWHLGIDKDADPHTKQAYSFPFGDFARVHRSGVVAGESRAGQYDHTEIGEELRKLRELIDGD